jgi:tellurite resistance protein
MHKLELLRAACCVAGSDGEVTESEKVLVDKLAKEIGVGQASLNAMLDRAKADPEFYKEQFRVLKAEPSEAMAVLLEVSLADGKVDETESNVLRELASRLNVPAPVFEQLVAEAKKIVE